MPLPSPTYPYLLSGIDSCRGVFFIYFLDRRLPPGTRRTLFVSLMFASRDGREGLAFAGNIKGPESCEKRRLAGRHLPRYGRDRGQLLHNPLQIIHILVSLESRRSHEFSTGKTVERTSPLIPQTCELTHTHVCTHCDPNPTTRSSAHLHIQYAGRAKLRETVPIYT